ncbi:MAG: mechanosensitive ion channel [Candidatus Omnitrophica bacterium]|nr:mechanosensitive ion channel [Candidatus Omnitrophota bacterium]
MITPQFSLNLILGALIIGIIIQWFLPFFIKKLHEHVTFKNLPVRLDPLIGPLRLLIPALAVFLILPLLDLDITPRLQHFLQLCILACLGWLVKTVVHIVCAVFLQRYKTASDKPSSRNIYTQIRIIENIINFLIAVLTISLMIMTFTEAKEVGVSVFASAGVMSIIIGFAAQKTLGNLIAGIQIAITQPIRLEDAVVVEDEWGWIEEITLAYVIVRLWDLRRLVLPISYFIDNPFENWTMTSSQILGSITLYVDYKTPVDKVRGELTRILERSSYWDKKVSGLQVTDIKEHTVELRALMSAADSSASWDLRCEVREKLLEFLRNNYPDSLPLTRVEFAMNKEAQSLLGLSK